MLIEMGLWAVVFSTIVLVALGVGALTLVGIRRWRETKKEPP